MLGFSLITFFMASGCAHTPVKKEFGPWQKSTVGKYLSLQTPGDLKAADVALSDELKLKIDSIKNYNLDSGDPDNYLCFVNFFTFNSKIIANLDGAADNVVNGMQKDPTLSDFKASRQYIQLGKLKGVRLDGTFNTKGKAGEIHAVVFTYKNLLWTVAIEDLSPTKLTSVTNTILDSVQINVD